jgi:hypothetical protein
MKPSATFAVMDPDELAGKKGGRERGSSAYSTTEHQSMLLCCPSLLMYLILLMHLKVPLSGRQSSSGCRNSTT